MKDRALLEYFTLGASEFLIVYVCEDVDVLTAAKLTGHIMKAPGPEGLTYRNRSCLNPNPGIELNLMPALV